MSVPTARPDADREHRGEREPEERAAAQLRAIDFWPCSEDTALITAKNTSGTAIILIRLT